MRKFLLMTTCLVALLTGCGSSQVIESESVDTEPTTSEYEEVEELDIHTELLTLYYPDGSKEEITFEWDTKTYTFRYGSYYSYYLVNGEYKCVVSDSMVFYGIEKLDDSNKEDFSIHSGTFSLETISD